MLGQRTRNSPCPANEHAYSLPPSVSSTLDEFPPYRHRVYGLTVATWIPFPELEPAPADAPVDAVFRLGEVPVELAPPDQTGVGFQATPGKLLMWVNEGARYWVREGREIIVQPKSDAPLDAVRVLLLCWPLGALLLQRKLLPLHASVIATPRGAVAFLGASRAGKSTLAAHFRKTGFRVLSDDVAVVQFAPDGRPWIAPGYPQFKLWPEVAEKLGEDASRMPNLWPSQPKRSLSFQHEFHSTPLPVARLYVLEPVETDKVQLSRLSPFESIRCLAEHTYRAQFVPGLGLQGSHFQAIARLADAVPLTRVRRPAQGFQLDRLTSVLAADFGAA